MFIKYKALFIFIAVIICVIFLWFYTSPTGLNIQAWHLFLIFFTTIVGVVLRPFPTGIIAILALTLSIVTYTLPVTEALSGFSNEVIWLIIFAFFISKGFLVTGLGSRIAYLILRIFGRNSLGLGYGIALTDLILAPAIPSVTARIGGIVFPILKSTADFVQEISKNRSNSAFFIQIAFQCSMITSAMFLTSMAGNPLIVEMARGQGIEISWVSWMVAASVPGIISLAFVPYLLFLFFRPSIESTGKINEMIRKNLRDLGKMTNQEWVMLFTFILLIILWIFGPYFHMKATTAAMVGLSVLFLTRVLHWKDILQDQSAWDTFVWFSILVTFASYLNELGFTLWLSKNISGYVEGFNWKWGFLIVSLIYFYSHYFFASCIAHIGAMYIGFLTICITLGAPPMLSALTLGFFSSLMGTLTHYGSGQAPILFSTGYSTTLQWWKVGFFISLVNIIIWLGAGGVWWKILNLW